MRSRRAALAVALAIAFCSSSCGGDSGTKLESGPPTILTQPASQTVAEGQTATFSVEAQAAQTYQWFWNGWSVAGGTNASLTTRPAEVADDGSTYTVVASNAHGSVTSAPATLTVSPVPRAPKLGDLRFQGVDAAPVRIPVLHTNILSRWEYTFYGKGGTPLAIGPGACTPPSSVGCSWFLLVFYLPPTAPLTNVLYTTGWLDGLESALDALAIPGAVITSLDLDDAAGAWGLSRVEAVGGAGFDLTRHSVPPADLAAAIAAVGAAGRVVTAISFHAGNAYFLSYGWSGDPAAVYETALANATLAAPGAAAADLAAAGYIVTALGRDGNGGLVLVGTRVAGDVMPRPLEISTDADDGGSQLVALGYAIVGYVFDEATGTWTWIGQQ